jgi:hypothetical protein
MKSSPPSSIPGAFRQPNIRNLHQWEGVAFAAAAGSTLGLLLDVPAEKPRHEVLAEGRRRRGAERHAPQGAKLVEAERPHAVDLGLDRLAIEQ